MFVLRLVAVWPVWRPVVRLSAAGEGVFTVSRPNPQPLFFRKADFFCVFVKVVIFQRVRLEEILGIGVLYAANIRIQPTHIAQKHHILRYPQTCPQGKADSTRLAGVNRR